MQVLWYIIWKRKDTYTLRNKINKKKVNFFTPRDNNQKFQYLT